MRKPARFRPPSLPLSSCHCLEFQFLSKGSSPFTFAQHLPAPLFAFSGHCCHSRLFSLLGRVSASVSFLDPSLQETQRP